jgi:hypothetical protein
VSLEDQSRPGEGGSEKTIAAVNDSLPNAADIADFVPAYIAVMVDRFGTPRRRPYMNLHHASRAVQRARAQGRQAWLILCRLEPVTGDLGEWSE